MDIELKENERIDDLEYKGLKIIQKTDGFCFGMDSVILSSFAKINKKNAVVADFGTGTGIISILLASKNDNIAKVYGFEIQEEMAEMAQRSVKMNDLNDKIEIVNADIVELSKQNWKNKFDVIVSNPPYKKLDTGLVSQGDKKLISRHEVKCTLEDIAREVSKCLKDNGSFYMVHRPERIVDICSVMRQYKLEPKEIRLVYPQVTEGANLVLIRCVKCGKPYVKVLNPLVVYDKNYEYTDEIYQIYSKNRNKKENFC